MEKASEKNHLSKDDVIQIDDDGESIIAQPDSEIQKGAGLGEEIVIADDVESIIAQSDSEIPKAAGEGEEIVIADDVESIIVQQDSEIRNRLREGEEIVIDDDDDMEACNALYDAMVKNFTLPFDMPDEPEGVNFLPRETEEDRGSSEERIDSDIEEVDIEPEKIHAESSFSKKRSDQEKKLKEGKNKKHKFVSMFNLVKNQVGQNEKLDWRKMEEKKKEAEKKKAEMELQRMIDKDRKQLIVRNVPFEASPDEVESIFAKFDGFKSLHMAMSVYGKHKGFGFVNFADKDNAKSAFFSLGAEKTILLHNKKIFIEYGRSELEFVESERRLLATSMNG